MADGSETDRVGVPVSVHTLVPFPCPRCGALQRQLTIAPLLADGRVDMTPMESPAGTRARDCNACTRLDSDKAAEDRRRDRRTKAWQKKHGGPVLATPFKPKPRPA